jgi:serine/threonine protein kinase
MSAHKKVPIIIQPIVEDHSIRRSNGEPKKYRTGKLLGKGGFAKCWELTSFDSNRTYAGKVIAKASLTKPSSKRKLLNEIKIHRSLKYVNVVRFERFFEDKNNVYILLEVASNETLMELVKRRKRLTEAETKYYMWQLCNTVQHLHKHRVIHRDLKLGNLFLAGDMQIKVGDFGLAAKLEYGRCGGGGGGGQRKRSGVNVTGRPLPFTFRSQGTRARNSHDPPSHSRVVSSRLVSLLSLPPLSRQRAEAHDLWHAELHCARNA